MSDSLPPLPDFSPSFRPRRESDNGGFTADQMQEYARAYAAAAVAAERERCALLCIERSFKMTGAGEYETAASCADLIRRSS